MTVELKLGQQADVVVEGHSAVNGAVIPNGAVALTSNDITVATVPESTPVPDGGAQKIVIPLTILAAGTTDIHATVTLTDGTIYEATVTVVISVPEPGLIGISVTVAPRA